MSPEKTDYMKQCNSYLTDLLNKDHISGFQLKYFENLMQFPDQNNPELLQKNVEILLKIFKKYDKNVELKWNIAYAISIIVFHGNDDLYLIFDKIFKSKLIHYELIEDQLKDKLFMFQNENFRFILLLGIIKLMINQEFKFKNISDFDNFNIKVKNEVISSVTKLKDINFIIHLVYSWIRLNTLQEIEVMRDDTIHSVLKFAVTFIFRYWDNHISEIRSQTMTLFLKCMHLNHLKIQRSKQTKNNLPDINEIVITKSILNEITWNLPFKYFAYLNMMKFFSDTCSVTEVEFIKFDICEGFHRSLQIRRILSIETDIFNFWVNNIDCDCFQNMIYPLICSIISSDNTIMASNFSKLWLHIILKKFPKSSELIFAKIPSASLNRTEVHSIILSSLFKICQEKEIILPIMEDKNQFLNFLEECLFDCESVRAKFFLLFCNLHDQSVLHDELELMIILKFLKNNVHSNCTVLRQYLFSAFAKFVLRLICSSIKIIKNNNINETKLKLNHIFIFLNELNKFIINGIQPGCNYQRKITSLNLYKIFMTYSVENCGKEIRKNNLKDAEKFVNFIKNCGHWKFTDSNNFIALFRCLVDPCEDIQQLSFLLLKIYFSMKEIENYKSIFNDALNVVKEYQFYRRNCGVFVIITFISLFYNNKNDTSKFSLLIEEHCNFSVYFLYMLKKQIIKLQQDVLYSALYDPLDATINILMFLITDDNSPEFNLIQNFQFEQVIYALKEIVPLLLRALVIDQFSDYAPSFEESDIALQSLIEKSTIYKTEVQDILQNNFQLYPLSQILLNYIWLSLKICCEFGAKLVSNRINCLNDSQITECSNLIVNILKFCRHKGVIEAAGDALSNLVQALNYHNKCQSWLKSVVIDVIQLIEFKNNATISRKSAGLCLIVQSIVSNDKQAAKSLFQTCWFEFRRILSTDLKDVDISTLQELPQTHALHLLKVLIADNRNSLAISLYFEEITELCINMLKIPIWTVRNASLQLFGAIMPKIIGQKNTENNYGFRRSFEEIFLNMPKVLLHIVEIFKQTISEQHHSRKLTDEVQLVPLLVFLKNTQVCSISLMETEMLDSLLQLRRIVKELLFSKAYVVRELACKVYISLHCKTEVIEIAQKLVSAIKLYIMKKYERNRNITDEIEDIRNENHLHGYLLVLKYISVWQYNSGESYFFDLIEENSLKELNLELLNTSLISQTLLFDLRIINLDHYNSKNILLWITYVLDRAQNSTYILLGYEEWILTLIKFAFRTCDKHSMINLIEFCLNSKHVKIIIVSLETLCKHPKSIIDSYEAQDDNICILFNMLLNFTKKFLYNSDLRSQHTLVNCIFQILINLNEYYPPVKWSSENLLKLSKNIADFLNDNFDLIIHLNYYHYQARNLHVLCLLMRLQSVNFKISDILETLRKTFDVNYNNRDIRLNSSKSVLFLCEVLVKNKNKYDLKTVWIIIVDILLDEDAEIRLTGCKCFMTIHEICDVDNLYDSYLNPHFTLNQLFDFEIMYSHFTTAVIIDMLLDILLINDFSLSSSKKLQSPFDQGIVNFYKEDIVILHLAGKCLQCSFITKEDHFCKYLMANVKFLNEYFSNVIEDMINFCKNITLNVYLLTSDNYYFLSKCYYLFCIFIALTDYFHLLKYPMNIIEDVKKICRTFENNVYFNETSLLLKKKLE